LRVLNYLKQSPIFLIGLAVGLAFWFIEAGVHTYIFNTGLYVHHVFKPDSHEVWMRLLVMDIFIGFAAIAQILFNRQKRAEEATRAAYQELDQIFQTAADGMRVVDRNFNILRMNETFAAMAGVSREEGANRKCYEVFHGPLCQTQNCPLLRAFKGEEHFECEVEKVNHQGKTIPCILTATTYRDQAGNILGIVEDFKDITERKESEKAIRFSEGELRFLSGQLISAQERERKRLSVELHAELGQALMVLKLKLRAVMETMDRKNAGLVSDCEDVLLYVDEIIDKVRQLSRDLSPSLLEDLGLFAALRRLFENNSLSIEESELSDLRKDESLFSQESRIIIYRIIQECLTNIGRYAQATRVRISATRHDSSIFFKVEDNGVGFNVGKAIARMPGDRGMGLAAMQERARMLGGYLNIVSKEGEGTCITFSIPLNK